MANSAGSFVKVPKVVGTSDDMTSYAPGSASSVISEQIVLPYGMEDIALSLSMDSGSASACSAKLQHKVGSTWIDVPGCAIGNVVDSAAISPLEFLSGAIDTGTNQFNVLNHGLVAGQIVRISTAGTLPGGLSAATDYWVIATSVDVFKLASSLANAVAATAIDLTSQGVGSQTVTPTAYSAVSVAQGAVDTEGNLVKSTAHGFVSGVKGQLTTTVTLPTGLSLATNYWMIRTSADVFKFASSIANASAGTAVDITALGSGTHTFTPSASSTLKTFVDADVNTGTENINIAAHGFSEGQIVRLTTDGVLPTGLALATDYFVIVVDADNIKLAASLADALVPTPVNITAAAGGGTHTATPTSYSTKAFISGVVDTEANTVVSTAHGLKSGLRGQFTTSGSLPTGLSASTNYWIIRVDADTYKVASSLSNSSTPTAIDITALGSGTLVFTPNNSEDAVIVASGAVDVETNKLYSASHGLVAGTVGQVSSSGTLPGGLSASTDYYVIVSDSDNIKLATSLANAQAGTAVDITTDGIGIMTFTPSLKAAAYAPASASCSGIVRVKVGISGSSSAVLSAKVHGLLRK